MRLRPSHVFISVALIDAFIIGFLYFSNPAHTALSTLPSIPTSVGSQIGPAPVLMVHDLLCGGEKALGCFTVEDHTIRIDDASPLNVQWQTLEHEKLHMIISDAGLVVSPDLQDQIADAVGSYRVMEMNNHWQP